MHNRGSVEPHGGDQSHLNHNNNNNMAAVHVHEENLVSATSSASSGLYLGNLLGSGLGSESAGSELFGSDNYILPVVTSSCAFDTEVNNESNAESRNTETSLVLDTSAWKVVSENSSTLNVEGLESARIGADSFDVCNILLNVDTEGLSNTAEHVDHYLDLNLNALFKAADKPDNNNNNNENNDDNGDTGNAESNVHFDSALNHADSSQQPESTSSELLALDALDNNDYYLTAINTDMLSKNDGHWAMVGGQHGDNFHEPRALSLRSITEELSPCTTPLAPTYTQPSGYTFEAATTTQPCVASPPSHFQHEGVAHFETTAGLWANGGYGVTTYSEPNMYLTTGSGHHNFYSGIRSPLLDTHERDSSLKRLSETESEESHSRYVLPPTYERNVGFLDRPQKGLPFGPDLFSKPNSLGPMSSQPLLASSTLSAPRHPHSPDSSTDTSKNVCPICGKVYARPSTLKTHMRTHSGERPYRCFHCNKSFSQAANLTAHCRTHSGEKPFQCGICHRRFSQSSSVTTHMRTHSGERPYKCRLCRKAFSDSSTLTKHMRIHSGEKPYECKLCHLKFSQSGNLNRHMRIHLQQASQQR